MTEFSDYTNSYIICVILIGYIFYLMYLKLTIVTENEWSNIKCTPIYLLMGTLLGQGNDENIFQKCIQKNTRKELQRRHIQEMKNNENDVRESTTRMNVLLDNENNSIENKQAELLRLIDGANESMEETILKQNRINQAIVDSQGPLKTTINKMEEVVDNTKDLYTAFTSDQSKIKPNP